MAQLIECIPNFSEARRPEVVDEIARTIESVPGIRLLDRSSDLDHNRTVLTFVGAPAAVEQAAYAATQRASQRIDMNEHRGEHPRIGATDVVPFVPLSDVTMEDCVALARRLARRVGETLHIPVYLYEYAATRPERANLEDLRRGQYEGLKQEILKDPARKPDFGPIELGTAGATVIGARDPLIAFNIYLDSSDVDIARRIARAIRHSSGGMRYIKALGLLVGGKAQVSINMTNFHESPVGRVVELVRREAERYGVAVHHSEVVGLIPQQALVDAAVWYTQLDGFGPDQVLENKLFQGLAGETFAPSTADFLEQLAAATPSPGGGSAAAHAAAVGASLVEMVSGLTLGKERYKDVADEMEKVRTRARELRAALTRAVDEDAGAYEAVMAAYRMPKDGPAHLRARDASIQAAMLGAARVPLKTASGAVDVMDLAARCAQNGNRNAISDALSGVAMARAALTAAAYNVRINLFEHPDADKSKALLAELAELESRAEKLEAASRRSAQERARMA